MPWPVYSERILAIAAPATESHFQVPPAHRLVIKHVVFISTVGTNPTMQLNVANRVVLWHVFQASVPMAMWSVMLVAYAGDYVSVFTNSTSPGCSVNGFLFADPLGREGPPEGVSGLPSPPLPAIPIPSIE